jgi:PKD domain
MVAVRRLVSFVIVATAGLALLVLGTPAALAQATTTSSPTTTAPTSTTSPITTAEPTSTAEPTTTATPTSTTSPTGLTNDHFADATVINTVPFSVSEDASQATFDASDPSSGGCSNRGSVWFAYTPTSEGTIDADTFGSSYDTVLSAWTGSEGALSRIACNDDFGSLQSRIDFKATPGTTYYFMVARCCGLGGDGGGLLTFSLDQIDPADLAANDAFADAAPIASLPFSDTVDLSRSTIEPSERSPFCVSGILNSVWYAFTPATDEFVTATINQSGVGLGVETGSSLTNPLNEIGCIESPDRFTFRAQANTTYYFQVGGFCCDGFGPVTLSLDVAPDPVSEFDFVPRDPSSLDTVQFYDFAFDPAGAGISSLVWRFGDGATTPGSRPTHQYAQDGDYTAELTVTTPDGRTATTSQVVQVRTHDVAIVGIGVPKSARVGQTIAVNVDVANKRYPETVQVDLYASSPGGSFQDVGSVTKPVPVPPRGGAVTRFGFRYTITQADRTAGQLTFTAQASVLDHRDAMLDNNQLNSTPVRVA